MENARTKIVTTLGPASQTPEVLEDMIRAGACIARINMSHGSHEENGARLDAFRDASRRVGRPGSVLVDLCGPKIRTAKIADPAPVVKAGDEVVLVSKGVEAAPGEIPTGYASLHEDVKPDEVILLDDGKIRLRTVRIDPGKVVTRVEEGGPILSNKGINLPGTEISIPSLTDKDRRDVAFAAAREADFVALSFVRKAQDIHDCRAALAEHGNRAFVIAKIEKPQAVADLDAILAAADGVMVARGDLAVEVSTAKVPLLQKEIIRKANKAGKLVITATQMLESMVDKTMPTRAEAADVANAVLDGTDAVMLSGETATGRHPAHTVATMASIAREVEASPFFRSADENVFSDEDDSEDLSIAHAAYVAAREYKADALVVFTETGHTAQVLSKFKPRIPIFALTPHPATERRMALVWGTIPVHCDFSRSAEEMIKRGETALVENGALKPGDKVIFTAGTVPAAGGTDMMKVHRVGAP